MVPSQSWLVAMMMIMTLSSLLVVSSTSVSPSSTPEPPVAKRIPWERNIHGITSTDYYYWLRDLDTDGDVRLYIDAENNYTQAIMNHTTQLQNELGNELAGRYVDSGDDSRNLSFWQQGHYTYYLRYDAGSAYETYCRRRRYHDGTDGDEEILLDVNELAQVNSSEFLAVGVFEISPDETLLAFSIDRLGNERFQLYFKNITSGMVIPSLNITDTYYHLRWAQSSSDAPPYVFFTSQDWLGLPRYVYRYEVPSLNPSSLHMVYNATTDDGYYTVAVFCTNDNEYVTISLYTDTDNSILILPASTPLASFVHLYPHQRDVRYDVEHHNGTFLIRTNGDGTATGGITHVNFRVVAVPVATPSPDHWVEVIPMLEGERWIDLVESFRTHMAIWTWQDGLRFVYLRAHDAPVGNLSWVQVPMDPLYTHQEVYSMMPGTSSDLDDRRYRSFDTDEFVYCLRSFTRPITVYSFPMSGDTSDTWTKIASDTTYTLYPTPYDPELYTEERIWTTASDGRRIPTSIVYRTDKLRRGVDGGNPMYLIGYGAYGGVEETQYDADYISLLDRGVIHGWAHIRGDGDMGWSWWKEGRVDTKRNTITDFIAVSEHLIELGYTSSDRLAVRGRSAGGILAGSLLILKPTVFKVVIAMVPFLDTVTTEMDISIPWAQWEWLEWGSPYVRAIYDYMMSYSPYDNIDAVSLTNFPNVMVTSGLYDPRVKYYEPTKFVAKLRAHIAQQRAIGNITTGEPRVVLVTENAGHFGATSLDGRVAAQAYMFAYILDAVINTTPSPRPESKSWSWWVYFLIVLAVTVVVTIAAYMYRRMTKNEPVTYSTLATNERLAREQVTSHSSHTTQHGSSSSSGSTMSGSGSGHMTSVVISSSASATAAPTSRLFPSTSPTYSSTSSGSSSTSFPTTTVATATSPANTNTNHTRTTSGTMLV